VARRGRVNGSLGVEICTLPRGLGEEFPNPKIGYVRDAAVIVKRESDPRLAVSIAAVRITWIAAIVVCGLAILSGLLSGTNVGDPSLESPGSAFADSSDSPQLLPEVALLDPAQPVGEFRESQMKAQRTKTAAPQDDWGQRAKEQAPGENRSGSQPDDSGGGTPTDRPEPNPPQSPSVTRPDPPQEPSGNPEPSQPTVEVSVAESEVSVSASREGVSAQVKTPLGTTGVTVGLG
jgi:hypothetical protein